MVYDHMDLGTKAAIAIHVKYWLKQEENANQIKAILMAHNLTDAPLPDTKSDIMLVRTLQLIGTGWITPTLVMREFGIMVRVKYQIPRWVYDSDYWEILNNHVDQILDTMDELRKHDAPACIYQPCLDLIISPDIAKSVPRRPVYEGIVSADKLIREQAKRFAIRRGVNGSKWVTG